jgi:hypothetical protein
MSMGPTLPFTLSADRWLSPMSYRVPEPEVPTMVAKLLSQGWEEIPRHGRLEYARLSGGGVTMICYMSGLVCFIGLQAALAARRAA